MGYEYQKQRAAEIAAQIKAQGFRVFLAEQGTYGFFTDEEGTRVVSFQVNGLRDSVGGNYRASEPQKTGNGWQISESINPEIAQNYFDKEAPHWAVGKASWRHTTLEEHLATYQASSKYSEV